VIRRSLKRNAWSLPFACLLVACFADCGLILGADDYAVGPDVADAGTDSSFVDGLATMTDTGADVSPDSNEASTPSCPSARGPAMVTVNASTTYCIDSTEVTNQQYDLFVQAAAAADPDVTQTAQCGWNHDVAPQGCPAGRTDPNLNPKWPVGCVNWCDAWSYCHWAGKRLCGALGGGPVDFNSPLELNQEWLVACGTTAGNPYPYGKTFVPNACNSSPSGTLADVKSFNKCEGGYPGIYDMVGNVEEWIDSCLEMDAGPNDVCHELGNYYVQNFAPMPKCADLDIDSRNLTDPTVGFRCCATPQ
jgi:formylglycine-generating enzyme